MFAMLPPMAISSAVATMTAQNYGAGLIKRMNKCLASGIGIALVFGVSVCVYSQFLPETLTAFLRKMPLWWQWQQSTCGDIASTVS